MLESGWDNAKIVDWFDETHELAFFENVVEAVEGDLEKRQSDKDSDKHRPLLK